MSVAILQQASEIGMTDLNSDTPPDRFNRGRFASTTTGTSPKSCSSISCSGSGTHEPERSFTHHDVEPGRYKVA